jgi:hypothetical protein
VRYAGFGLDAFSIDTSAIQHLHQHRGFCSLNLLVNVLEMSGTGIAITNPLVLYRSLIATQKIRPDPAQHRLGME